MEWEGVQWIHLALDKGKWWVFWTTWWTFVFHKMWQISALFDELIDSESVAIHLDLVTRIASEV